VVQLSVLFRYSAQSAGIELSQQSKYKVDSIVPGLESYAGTAGQNFAED